MVPKVVGLDSPREVEKGNSPLRNCLKGEKIPSNFMMKIGNGFFLFEAAGRTGVADSPEHLDCNVCQQRDCEGLVAGLHPPHAKTYMDP